MVFKLLTCVVFVALAFSVNGQDCDTDLLWWARSDVFNEHTTSALQDALNDCSDNIASRMNPVPCGGSCNENICNFECAMRQYDFVSIFFILFLRTL